MLPSIYRTQINTFYSIRNVSNVELSNSPSNPPFLALGHRRSSFEAPTIICGDCGMHCGRARWRCQLSSRYLFVAKSRLSLSSVYPNPQSERLNSKSCRYADQDSPSLGIYFWVQVQQALWVCFPIELPGLVTPSEALRWRNDPFVSQICAFRRRSRLRFGITADASYYYKECLLLRRINHYPTWFYERSRYWERGVI